MRLVPSDLLERQKLIIPFPEAVPEAVILDSTKGRFFVKAPRLLLAMNSSRPDERQRFATVYLMDFGNDLRVVAAEDRAFRGTIVCILSVALNDSVKEWLRDGLPSRCKLYHPHVLKLYDVFLSQHEIHVIFENPKGNNLLSILMTHKLVEAHVRHLFQQLVFAIDYFHSMGVEGMDLVLESVFYDAASGILKTVDFGLNPTKKDEHTYSLSYTAPEQLQNPFNTNAVHRAADVWRLGVLLFCMLFRRFPFCPSQETTKQQHIFNILRVKWSVPEDEHPSSECIDLLKRIFTSRPDERMTVGEIKNHSWYQKDLPDGVMHYEFIERPNDGLLQKVRNISEILAV